MIRKRKFHRELQARLELAGFEDISWAKTGKHFRISCRSAGKMVHCILPGTPSDFRAMANMVADVKRQARQAETEPPCGPSPTHS